MKTNSRDDDELAYLNTPQRDSATAGVGVGDDRRMVLWLGRDLMAAITVTLTATCPGGNHLTMAISGDKTATVPITLAELAQPITDEDVIAFMKVLTKMARIGRTNAQARTLLQSGITVTV